MHVAFPTAVEDVVRKASPRHRRWQRLLDGLTIDPDELPRPISPPSDRDFIICGCPRSGTTLLAAILWQPPHVATVSEPWDGLRLAPADLFRSLRDEIATTGSLRRGRLDVDRLSAERAVVWGRDGELRASVAMNEGFLLGVKWPAFWRYLPLLPQTKFLVCVRDPIEVIESFVHHGGDLVRGMDYRCAINRAMNEELTRATDDLGARRALLYEYINSRVLPYLDDPNVFVVRYERWFTDRDRLVDEIGRFLGRPIGQGMPDIRTPRSRGTDPETRALVDRFCPSAPRLGYRTT